MQLKERKTHFSSQTEGIVHHASKDTAGGVWGEKSSHPQSGSSEVSAGAHSYSLFPQSKTSDHGAMKRSQDESPIAVNLV